MLTRSKNIRSSCVVGLLLAGLTGGSVMAWPDDKPRGDRPETEKNRAAEELERILDKLPPEARERITAEIRRAREQAEKARAEIGNEARRIKEQAEIEARRMKEQIERARAELMEKAERAAAQAKEEAIRARAEAELQVNRMREEVSQRERAAANRREEAAKREEAPRRDGERRVEERREVRVEVRKDGDKEPQVTILDNGRQVDPGKAKDIIAKVVPGEPLDLSKLPPEKREVIERARRDMKEAQERLKVAAEKLAKAEGRENTNVGVMMFKMEGPGGVKLEGQPNIQLRMVPGDRLPNIPLPPGAGAMMGGRLPNIPLPPGAGAMGGRMPAQPNIPVPGMAMPPGAGPELERRVSKAEKALDEILAELKKLQSREEDDDDDDDDDKKKEKREEKRESKPKK